MDETFSTTFRDWWAALADSGQLSRVPEPPRLTFADDPRNRFSAEILARDPPEIRIFRGFIADIRTETERLAPVLADACLDGLELLISRQEAETFVTRTCHDLVVSLVLLHELFHMLCGHLDAARHDYQNLTALDEFALGLSINDPDPNSGAELADPEVLRAYYQELEADNCAIQCVLQLPLRGPLAELLSALDTAGPDLPAGAQDLPDDARVIAFRFLVASSWIMVRLFEVKRADRLRVRSQSHPLPGSRLLAAIATVLEEFAQASDTTTVEPDGRRSHVLTEESARDYRLFLDAVLKPVLMSPWPVRDAPDAADGFVISPLWVVQDLGNLMQNRERTTAPGRELSRLDSLRAEMNERFGKYRYY